MVRPSSSLTCPAWLGATPSASALQIRSFTPTGVFTHDPCCINPIGPIRALSPSTNDTTTAVMCVDYLTAIVSRLASRSIPSPHRYEDGELRVITSGPTFAKLVAESFDQIRGSAVGNVGIMLRMLGALRTIASLTANPSRRRALREQVQWLAELAERTVESSHERSRIDVRLTSVREALEDALASQRHGGKAASHGR